jgi:hypothetical protein
MFKAIAKYIASSGMPACAVGDEATVRDRLREGIAGLKCSRRIQQRCFGREPGGDRKIRRSGSSEVAGVKIILRGDSGFCRNELMNWCEGHGVDYVFGLARNQRLRKIIWTSDVGSDRAVEPNRQAGASAR